MSPSLGSYDQVVALTQEMINKGLSGMYDAVQSRTTGQVVIPSFGPQNCQFTDLKLGCPRIIIRTTDEDKSHIHYQVHLTSGTLKSADWANPSNDCTVPIKDWYLTYIVNLGLADVTDKHELATLKDKLLVPGDFSLTKLIIDMKATEINTFSTNLSSFGGNETGDHPKLTPQARTDIAMVMQRLHADNSSGVAPGLALEDLKVLGYVASGGINKAVVNSVKATFVPSGLQFQSYPWKSTEGVVAAPGVEGNSRLNYLCYLEKTLNPGQTTAPPMPTGDNKYLKYTGNWTSGDIQQNQPSDDLPLGSFVLSSACFIEQYLLPKLRDLIARMWIRYFNLSANTGKSEWWHTTVSVSYNDPKNISDDAYKWTKTSNNSSTTWNLHLGQGKDTKSHGSMKVDAESSYDVSVTVTSDSPTIKVSGASWLRLYCERWVGVIDCPGTISYGDDVQRTFNWSFDLQLDSVSDGGLQISMANRNHTIDINKDKRNLGDLFPGIMDWLVSQFDKYQWNNLGDLENALATDIGNSHKLFFPCGGVFYYKDPKMTSNGDLMCAIAYKPSGRKFAGPDRSSPAILPATDPIVRSTPAEK